jgi:iron(III) transport system substrate-binding protein
VNEGRAKRHAVDVVETNGPEMEMLAREKLLSEFHSSHIADLPQGMIPKHRMWMPDRVNFFVVAFNTQKLKREDLPKHYEGFTDPKWKGRIAIEATDAEWMGGLVNELGEQRGMGEHVVPTVGRIPGGIPGALSTLALAIGRA